MDIRGHILLRLALVGNGVHAQERSGIDEQTVGKADKIDRTTGCRSDVNPYPVFIFTTILTERDLLKDTMMQKTWYVNHPSVWQEQTLRCH